MLDWLPCYMERWDMYTSTISDVICVMEKIGESVPKNNGFGSFNWLYLAVTRAVERHIAEERHLSDDWLQNLDIAFAKLYFDAITLWSKKDVRTPRAWRRIFEAHRDPRIRPVQFAIAGLNAHISVDLPLAVAQVSGDPEVFKRGSDEHQDFLRINPILSDVEIQAMWELSGKTLRDVCNIMEPYDRYAIMALVTRMRNRAWKNAKRIAAHPKKIQDCRTLNIIDDLDRETEMLNRIILTPAMGFPIW